MMCKCIRCGTDLKEDGVLCEASIAAHWNEKTNSFSFDITSIDQRNLVVKCPACFSTGLGIKLKY